MVKPIDADIYPVITPRNDEERLIATISHEISAGFDAVLQAEPPSVARISAALGAVTGTVAAIISMTPREGQARILSFMVKAIRRRLKELAEEPRPSTH